MDIKEEIEDIKAGLDRHEGELNELMAYHMKSNPHIALKDEEFLLGLDRRIEENESIDAGSFLSIYKKLEVLDEHLQGITKYYTTLKENVNQLSISKQYKHKDNI